MNAKKFSEAMGELDNRYVDEAIDYKRKAKKPGWLKWGAMAACLTLICVAAISLLTHNGEDTITAPGVTDAPPMVYVNGTLYKQSTEQISYGEPKEEFIYLGRIEGDVTSDQSITDGVPKESFQANHPIVGAEVYQYNENIVIQINGDYWLYEIFDADPDGTKNELSEEEKKQHDPSYKAS